VNTNSSIARRSWRLAVLAAVLVLAASAGSAAAATSRTPAPSPSAPGTTVQRMVKDCHDAMRSGSSGTTPMMDRSTGTNMMGGADRTGMMDGS